ncbi:MAG: hypothetical protein IJX51_08790 [Clostridia bacterium]|nr:hypothetical protein [Clostridia bacterium]
MRIELFKNNKGLIHGSDSKRIACDVGGTLRIGTVEIPITIDTEAIVPVLFNGCTGVYNATFTSALGNVYELERVAIKGGRIVPPSQQSVELMEMRCRIDTLEDECKSLREENLRLSNLFDTDALNFLIK